MVSFCADLRRTVHVVNLDPAAEEFNYPVTIGKCYCTLRNNNTCNSAVIIMCYDGNYNYACTKIA